MKKPAASREVQCESECAAAAAAAAATAVAGPVADEAADSPTVLEPSPKASAKPKAKGKAKAKPAAKSKASARPTPPADDSGQLVGNLPSWYWYYACRFLEHLLDVALLHPFFASLPQVSFFATRYSYQKSFQRVLLQKLERLRSES